LAAVGAGKIWSQLRYCAAVYADGQGGIAAPTDAPVWASNKSRIIELVANVARLAGRRTRRASKSLSVSKSPVAAVMIFLQR
jgi:hypothetical protein